MSGFQSWFVADQLSSMGRSKAQGILAGVEYVETQLVDLSVERAIMVSVGLGAGRPQLGVALLADTFENNPWTAESTVELLQQLRAGGSRVEDNPELLPWTALYASQRMEPFGNEMPWQELDNPNLLSIWAIMSACGVFWGLTHEEEMQSIFAKNKEEYERTAATAVAAGGAVADEYPWSSVEAFYEACQEQAERFQAERQPLLEIPAKLRKAPEIARRLNSRGEKGQGDL